MATALPSTFDNLLEKLIGSSTSTNVNETLAVQNQIKQLLTSMLTEATNQQQTQQQSQNTQGTTASTQAQQQTQNQQQNQQQNTIQQIISALTGSTNTQQTQNQATTSTSDQTSAGTNTQNTTGLTNQNTTGTTTSTTSTGADVAALQKVFQQQQAGITPQMLAAIFQEGSKAAPGLVASTANAVGARSSSNSPLATALTELNSSLTAKAASMNQDMLAQSGETAARIADLTKQQTTTGTNTQQAGTSSSQSMSGTQAQQTGTTGTQSVIGTTNTNQQTQQNQNQSTNTQQNTLSNLLASLANNTQGSTTNQQSVLTNLLNTILGNKTSTTNQNTDTNQNQNTQRNTDQSQSSTINAKSAGLTAGGLALASLLGGDGSNGSGIGGLLGQLKSLFPGGGAAGLITNSDGVSLPAENAQNPFNNPMFDDGSGGSYYSPTPDFSWLDDPGGFADGGLVSVPQLKLTPVAVGQPDVSKLLALLDGGTTSAKKDSTPAASAATVGVSSDEQAARAATEAATKENPANDGSYAVDGKRFGYNAPGYWSFEDVGGGAFSPEFLKSIGFKTDNVARDGTPMVYVADENGSHYTDDWNNFLASSGLRIGRSYDNERSNNYHYAAFDKNDKQVGDEFVTSADDDPGNLFGTAVMLMGAAFTGGAAGAGAAAAGAGPLVAGAATGAAGGFTTSYLGSDMNLQAGLKGAAVGGLTGGLTAGVNPAASLGINNPALAQVVNGTVSGAVKGAINGNASRGAQSGAVSGGMKGIGTLFGDGFADGGPIGVQDNIMVPVSHGEYIVPADVVQIPGMLGLLEAFKGAFHTPAEVQRGKA